MNSNGNANGCLYAIFITLQLFQIYFHAVHILWLFLLLLFLLLVLVMITIELISINYGNGKLIEKSHDYQLAAVIFPSRFVVVVSFAAELGCIEILYKYESLCMYARAYFKCG